MLYTLAVIDFIREHPGLAAALFGVLWTIVSVLVAFFHKNVGKRLDVMETRITSLEKTVSDVEVEYVNKVDALAIKIESTKTEILERIHDMELRVLRSTNGNKSRSK